MSSYNIFLASPKGHSDTATEEAEQAVYAAFRTALPASSEVSIVHSKTAFADSFGKMGSWDAWTTHIATGVDYEYRTPLFNAVVCVASNVGKATADIVRKALDARRMVAVMGTTGTLDRVTAVSCIDSDNWQTGWHLDTL